MKTEYLIAAKDQFNNAEKSLVMAVIALQMSEGDFEKTIKEIKETIGDLRIAIEVIEDRLPGIA